MRALVASARVARLGTVNDAGGADLVPITFALDGGVLVSAVDHKPKRSASLRRLDNIRARPDVTVLVDHYDDDWTALWWVRLRGRARVVGPDDPAHAAAVDPLVRKYVQYADHPPAGPAIVVALTTWHGWSASPT